MRWKYERKWMKGGGWADGESNDTSCGLEITSPVALMEWTCRNTNRGLARHCSVTVRGHISWNHGITSHQMESHTAKWNARRGTEEGGL